MQTCEWQLKFARHASPPFQGLETETLPSFQSSVTICKTTWRQNSVGNSRHWTLSWATYIWYILLRSDSVTSIPIVLPICGYVLRDISSTQDFLPFFHSSAIVCVMWSARRNLLDFIILTVFCEEHKLLISALCSCLQPTVPSPLLGSYFLLSYIISNALNLHFQLYYARSSFTHTNFPTIILYVLIFTFSDSKGEHRRFWTTW
jgi:hypothetical protein